MSSVRRSRRSQAGFSLAEVFVATAIFAVIFIAALLVYDRSNKVFKSGVEAADLQQNTRVAFDKLMADTRLAGFDFDRDGVPTAAGQAQQPDEQIEYAGPSAITIRGNFNYNAAENGRVAALESPNSQFPIVTTGNDEIVTYALVPDTPGAVTENLVFYADVSDGAVAKRQSYPGGSIEDTITITGVDLCDDDKNGDGKIGCDQPPYTLYRFTVNDAGGVERTPLANNIRDLKFTYYNDITGTSALAITDPGGGAYDPATPATLNAAARSKRAEIKAIRLSLVGLNQSGDTGWTQVGEPIASVQNRRQYTLESMVVPRNLGKRGMREQETTPPGAPVLKTVCFNYCGLVRVTWEAPPDTLTTGEVETYQVLWDTDVASTMSSPPAEAKSAGLALSTTISGLDPTVEYRFSVAAANSYGTAYATKQVRGKPLNDTTPKVATINTISGSGVSGAPAVEKNLIRLAWKMPTENTDTSQLASCKAATDSGLGGALTPETAVPELAEMTGVEVWRSTDPNFDPTLATLPATTVKVATASASAGTYADTTAANCVNYYYRTRVVESCGTDITKNVGTKFGNSDFYPAVGTAAMKGRAESSDKPSTPSGPLVVNVASEVCSGTPSTCSVTLTWPAVKTDETGATIAVDQYTVRVTDNTVSPAVHDDTRIASISAGTAVLSGGNITYTATGLVKKTPAYTLSARAENCSTPGDFSGTDIWPKCNFANGETLAITMTGVNDGDGKSQDTAYQVTGAETLKFAVTTAKLKSLTASVYNADTGAKVVDLTPATHATGAIFLQTTWPDAADNTDLRVDYVLTDNSTPSACSTSGSIFVRDTVVSCPFDTTVTPTTTTAAPSKVTFPLKNNTSFDITLIKAEVTWDLELAKVNDKDDVEVPKAEFPPLSGSTPVTITVGPPTPKASGTFTVNIGSSVAKLFGDDTTGNYKFAIYFEADVFKSEEDPNTDPIKGNPITKIDLYYKLAGDAAADPARFCTFFVTP